VQRSVVAASLVRRRVKVSESSKTNHPNSC
jgi:hypothetical protein